jgi:hypothetical protein
MKYMFTSLGAVLALALLVSVRRWNLMICDNSGKKSLLRILFLEQLESFQHTEDFLEICLFS